MSEAFPSGLNPDSALNAYRGGLATGGVRTSGGLSFGGRTTTLGAGPGAGRTSIGGGNGATCWLTTGALEAGGAAGGRGTLAFGFNEGRRGSRPGSGTSGSG